MPCGSSVPASQNSSGLKQRGQGLSSRHHAAYRAVAQIPSHVLAYQHPLLPVAAPTGHLGNPQSASGVPGSKTLLAKSTAKFTQELADLLGRTCQETCAFPGSHSLHGLREGMAAAPFMHTMSSWIILRASFGRAREGIKAMKADPGVYLSMPFKAYSPTDVLQTCRCEEHCSGMHPQPWSLAVPSLPSSG